MSYMYINHKFKTLQEIENNLNIVTYGVPLIENVFNLDPVVQSIVSLTISLRYKFVKQISAKVTNTLLFLLKKCENPLQCKAFSHFFNKK